MLASDATFNISPTSHTTKILSSLRNNSQFSDVLLLIGPDKVPMLVHSVVLACNSEYYTTALSNRWCSNDGVKLPPGFDSNFRIQAVLKHPDVEVDVMNCVLDYLYTGAATIPQKLAIKVALFANQVLLDGMKGEVETYLASSNGVTFANALEYYYCSETLGLSSTDCEKRALSVMAVSLKDSLVFGRDCLCQMDVEVIAKLLKAESPLTAAEKWEILVTWSKTRQNVVDIGLESRFPSDFDVALAQSDVKDLVNSVGLCNLSLKQYKALVEPYKCLLLGNIGDFVQAHFSIQRTTSDSNILDTRSFNRLMTKLTGCINLSEPDNHVFSARLLFRASTAGFSSRSFHAACDGKSHTVILIKLENGMIVGGYGDAAWHSADESIPVEESFLFSINQDPLFKALLFPIFEHEKEDGMYGSSSYGPTFALLEMIDMNCRSHFDERCYYENGDDWPIWNEKKAVEYEVFQLS
ncbi:hypothetical protein BDR26DRAFT_865662 [Obelidium mucronatum]|nr:hypothetical protein BDR26DRAFT_865662 [Obelidium mucronatum]